MPGKIRVLIVDDSALMRKILGDIISRDPLLEMIGCAKTGREALDKIAQLSPDVVTLDLNIPELDGLAVIEEAMKKCPTRFIMISAHTQQGASATIKALAAGAIDFIPKHSGEISLDMGKFSEEITTKIKMVAEVNLEEYLANLKTFYPSVPLEKISGPGLKKIVVIGASTGGPKIVLQIMRALPEDLPAAFLIVQHFPEGFTQSFAERISWESRLKAKEAQDGDVISASKAYVAAAGFHMVIEKKTTALGNELVLRLNKNPQVNFVRPSVTVTMDSAAQVFCPDVIGVILTGMGKDGLEGARAIKERGGKIFAQDQSTSTIFGMPKAVINGGLADKVLPATEIASEIIRAIKGV